MKQFSFINYQSILLLTFIIMSCGKDECHTFSGRILSFGTNEPVANAVVKIVAGKQVELFEPAVEWITDSVRTESDGRWEITVTEGDYHRVGPIFKEGYFSSLSSDQVTSLSDSGPTSNRDYFIDAKGKIHVILEDDPNFQDNYIEVSLPEKGSSDIFYKNFETTYEVKADRFKKYSYEYLQGSLIPFIVNLLKQQN